MGKRAAFALPAILLCWLVLNAETPTIETPMQIYRVTQLIAAADAQTAALIICGPDHADIVCEVVEVSQ